MKVAITGSSGHLGEALVRVLRSVGHDVFGVDVVPSPDTTMVGSILDPKVLGEAMTGATGVIHPATLHKPHLRTHSAQDFIDTNVSGTLAVLEAAVEAKISSLVYVSTTSTFGRTLTPAPGQPAAWITEESRCRPKNIYGTTKAAAEDLCELFHRDYGLPAVVLRTSRFFPEDDDAPADDVIDPLNIKVNELLHRRVDLADAVDACIRAVEQAPLIGFGRYVISATTPFADTDAAELRDDPATVVRRLYPDVEGIYAVLGWTLPASIDRVYVNKRARTELGWQPTWSFRRALDCLAVGEEPRSGIAVEVGAKGYHDQPTGVYTTMVRDPKATARQATWQYYDRRVSQGVPGIGNAVAYWNGLGVAVTEAEVTAEAIQVEGHLRNLLPTNFVEVGAGPGTFTGMLAGKGVAVDQSSAALVRLRNDHHSVTPVRADATALPFRDRSFERCFAAHIYGLLQPDERTVMLDEARRVAAEVWQNRSLPDSSRYRIYRRHFDAQQLAGEIGGNVIFAGSFYVMVAMSQNGRETHPISASGR